MSEKTTRGKMRLSCSSIDVQRRQEREFGRLFCGSPLNFVCVILVHEGSVLFKQPMGLIWALENGNWACNDENLDT